MVYYNPQVYIYNYILRIYNLNNQGFFHCSKMPIRLMEKIRRTCTGWYIWLVNISHIIYDGFQNHPTGGWDFWTFNSTHPWFCWCIYRSMNCVDLLWGKLVGKYTRQPFGCAMGWDFPPKKSPEVLDTRKKVKKETLRKFQPQTLNHLFMKEILSYLYF